ncbi:MAG: DUF4143 domain-containing protein [Coriobacteriia bacterium]|nr:DUF4143 domain-containing protein [Coriobacteriia bacterium]
MSLTEKGYQERIVDKEIDLLLGLFGALVIEGPKWCGKTWTVLNHAESITYLMDPKNDYANREMARVNPASVLEGLHPHAIDEWQEVVGIWDAVRFEVDRSKERGKFLLTGSTKPLMKKPLHSGIGRIGRVAMRPMTLFESRDSSGRISLKQIFENEDFGAYAALTDLEHLAYLSTRGGWPENRETPIDQSHRLPQNYLNELAHSEISELDDEINRDPQKVTALLQALARNTASTVSNATLQRDASNADNSLSKPTATNYLAALRRLYALEEISAWKPALRSKVRVQAAPKRMLVDPSLAVAGLGAKPQQLMRDMPTFGHIFESLCLRDLQVYARAIEGKLFHYRDSTGLEVDAIIELGMAVYGAFEVKLNMTRTDEAVASLMRFKRKMEQGGYSPPACMAVITGGGVVQKRPDGIYVVPITELKP